MKKNILAVFIMASVLLITGCKNVDKKASEAKLVPETKVIVVEEQKEETPKVEVVPVAPLETPKVIEMEKPAQVAKDSDGDKIPDKVDAEPKRALKDTLQAKGFQNLIILDNIKLGSDELSPSMLELLNAVSEILQSDNNIKVKVIGHTCDLGSDEFNINLSEKRAKAAQNYLLNKKTNAAQISVQWKGEKEPMVTNANEKNRSKNRRVQILFYEDVNKIN